MIHKIRKAAVLMPILAALAAPLSASETALKVHDAWIAEAPPGVRVNAGYLIIGNQSGRKRVLTDVTSPAFSRIEMHSTVISDDGTSSMQRQKRIPVPAGERFRFSPGGHHLMLFDGREPIRTGDEIPLILHFADGITIDTIAAVRRINSSHEHH
ncbi:MAG: copper chaperone PCu(A)C [Gammaproteobacteria bacterium]